MLLPLFKPSNIDLARQKELSASGKCCTTAWGSEEMLSLFMPLSTCHDLRQISSRSRPGSNCSLCTSCDTFATFWFPMTLCADSTRTAFMNEMATNRSGNINVPELNRSSFVDRPLNMAPFAVFSHLSETHCSSDHKVSAVTMLLHPALRKHLTQKRALLTSPHPSTSIYLSLSPLLPSYVHLSSPCNSAGTSHLKPAQ